MATAKQLQTARKNRAKSKAGLKRIRKIKRKIKQLHDNERWDRKQINKERKKLGLKPLPRLKYLGANQ